MKSFLERFELYHSPEPNTGCWLWSGYTNSSGYGILCRGGRGGERVLAHRAAWELFHGAAPPSGMLVCHRCDVPWCVNPDHLFLGTAKDNSDDMVAKGRARHPRAGHCPGAHNGNSKLTAVDVEEIRAARARGACTKRLAAQYGVSRSNVYAVCKDTWRHLCV